ncbi:MAG: hypothetical protein ACP5I8_05815 [Phycisphaerae bacterium]
MATKLMRKYSKPMMAFLGVLLMVTFLVGYSYQSGMGGSGDAFVLGKIHGRPLTKGDLTTARIDIRILRNLPALADTGLYPMWLSRRSDTRAAIQFYLLLREARQAGFFPDTNDINFLVQQKTLRQEIGQLLANSNFAQPNVIAALEDLTTIDQMQLFISGAGMPSSPQLAHFISELGTSVQLRYVRMEASDTAGSMPPPTAAQLQNLFNTYQSTLPWNSTSPTPPPLINGHRYPFGYRYPDRVKIEFLKFDRATALAKLKPTIRDIQAAYAYYQAHRQDYEITPNTKNAPAKNAKPVYKTFDQVRQELIRRQLIKRVNLLFHRMLNRARHIANKPWSTVDVDGYHKAIKTSQWVSFQKLATELKGQYGYAPLVGRWNHWLDAAELSSLRGIGDATTDQAGLPQAETLSVLAMKIRALDPHSKNIGLLLHLQVGYDGPVLTDSKGNKYLYRIIAVSKAHNPATLAAVRVAVMRDARELAAYQSDQESGAILATQAERLGLPTAAKAHHLVVYSPAPFKALENQLVGITPTGQPQYQIVPGHIPGVQVRSAKLMRAAFLLARQALLKSVPAAPITAESAARRKYATPGKVAAKLILTHPCASVALDPQLTVFVLQLANARPVPMNILQNSSDLAGATEYLLRNVNRRLLEQWFSYAAVVKRAGFISND